jgi:hypothetical protein
MRMDRAEDIRDQRAPTWDQRGREPNYNRGPGRAVLVDSIKTRVESTCSFCA